MESYRQAQEVPPLSAVPRIPNPEVMERPKRRTYSAEYKLRMLREVDIAVELGELGALLRREGLYSSHLQTWRRQKERGELAGLSSKKRGPKSTKAHPLAKRLNALETENRRLQKRLKHAELILDIQKKISELTGIPLKPVENEEND